MEINEGEKERKVGTYGDEERNRNKDGGRRERRRDVKNKERGRKKLRQREEGEKRRKETYKERNKGDTEKKEIRKWREVKKIQMVRAERE